MRVRGGPAVRLIAVALALTLACAGAATNPPQGPGTAFPCGYMGVSCGNHMCCDENEDCGGGPFNGCPAGYCCYNGDDRYVSLRPPRKQSPEPR